MDPWKLTERLKKMGFPTDLQKIVGATVVLWWKELANNPWHLPKSGIVAGKVISMAADESSDIVTLNITSPYGEMTVYYQEGWLIKEVGGGEDMYVALRTELAFI